MQGVYLTTIAGKAAIVRASEVMDGGMVEFFDAVTYEHRGCAGSNWWREPGHAVPYDGPLPRLPVRGRWL